MKFYHLRTMLAALAICFAIGQCAYAAEPGSPIPIGGANDQQAGSVLVYNYYTSSTVAGGADTRFTITNTNSTSSAIVHLFGVADFGGVADIFICLTPNQTARFNASDIDPGVSGYMIMIATDQTGVPINFNYLIGSAEVKLASGHEAKLNAEGFQALFEGPIVDNPSSFAMIPINFDGVQYTKAPVQLALDNVSSLADGISTLVVLNSLTGNLATGVQPIGNIFGLLVTDTEALFSFSFTAGAQFSSTLSNTFPRVTPRFQSAIPAGRSGWMQMRSTTDRAFTGAAINFKGANAGGFNGGSNLHHIRNTAGIATLQVVVFPPSC